MKRDDDVISSLKHPAVTAAREALGQAGKEGPSAFLVDGRRLVAQALASTMKTEAVFFLDPVERAEDARLLERAREARVACHLVRRGVFFRLLDLGYETSVRVLAVVRRPASRAPGDLAGPEGCFLVGERIQDPRNVGVLIRTADAWALAAAVFTADSADPYSRASVRSTTGSIFRVPVVMAARLVECLEGLRARGIRLIGTTARARIGGAASEDADSSRAVTPCWQADLAGPCAIVLGNESEGLSPEVRRACDELVTIPMSGGAQSLNVTVAAGIVLYERARQRQRL